MFMIKKLFLFFAVYSILQAHSMVVKCNGLTFDAEPYGILNNFVYFGHSIPGIGKVEFFNGKTEKQLEIDVRPDISVTNHSFKDKPGLIATHEVTSNIENILYTVNVKNISDAEEWLEVTLLLPFEFKDGFNYWNGFKNHFQPQERIIIDKLYGLFPLSAVYKQTGLAVGIEPRQIRSYLRAECSPKEQRIAYTTRMVLPPNESDTIKFVIFVFRDHFGWLDAVQKYYDSFPDVFRPTPGTSPQLQKAGAQYLALQYPDENIFHLLRKAGCGSEWYYGLSAGLRVGDWWPSGYTLDWQPRNEKPYTQEAIDLEMQTRQKKIASGKKYDLAAMSYTIPSFGEEKFLEQYFPDCILKPLDSMVRVKYDPWVYTNQASLACYIYGSKLWLKTKEDLKTYVTQWPIDGFAFDCGVPADPHFGPGAIISPGKAYEKDKGVYVTQGTSIYKTAEYLHSLKKDHQTVGTLINLDGKQAYYTWLTADAAIYEHPPQFHLYGYDPLHLKLFLGKRALTWWFGYTIPGWEAMRAEDIKLALTGLIDYTLLYSLKMGAYPNPSYTIGVPKMLSYIPVLTDLITNLGWEPSPGFCTPKGLWATRYGKDIGACLVAANAGLQDISGNVDVLNEYLGNENFIFADYEGYLRENTVNDGITRIQEVIVKSRWPVILRAVASFKNLAKFSANAEFQLQNGIGGKMTIRLNCGQKQTIASFWEPQNTTTASIMCNGEMISFTSNLGKIEAVIELRDGDNILEIDWQPIIRVEGLNEIYGFEFFNEDVPAATLLQDKSSVFFQPWLSSYFDSWRLYSHGQKTKITIPLTTHMKNGNKYIICGTPQSQPVFKEMAFPTSHHGIIKIENGNLIIAAGSDTALKKAIYLLFEVLDQTYVYYGYFSGTREPAHLIFGHSEIAAKLGLQKNYFPYFKQ